ncbi:MAG: hypothetical protein LBV08_01115 [Clostridiales bacterium]|nr:hypothetical protein [Clostridiales bacterium]
MSKIFKPSDIIFNDNKHLIPTELRGNTDTTVKKPEDSPAMGGVDLKVYNILERARKEAEKIINKANIDAEVIINHAQAEAGRLAEEVRGKAQKEGHGQGYKEGLDSAERLKQEAGQIKEEWLQKRENIYHDLEPEILGLIISITEKLLGNALEFNPDIILNLIRQGLNETTLSGDIIIRVSPEKYDLVLKNKEKILYMAEGSCNFEIIRDLGLHGSDCIIETAFGNIDCSLDEQFKLLKESLLLILENR